MAVPPRATDEQIHAAAEAAATEKARKHIDHYNATVSDIRWTSEN
jgi:hypothetical protein